jgi:hypothetical protein
MFSPECKQKDHNEEWMPVGTTKVAMFETSTQDNNLESERTVLIQLAGAWLNDGKRLCQLDLSSFKLGLL